MLEISAQADRKQQVGGLPRMQGAIKQKNRPISKL